VFYSGLVSGNDENQLQIAPEGISDHGEHDFHGAACASCRVWAGEKDAECVEIGLSTVFIVSRENADYEMKIVLFMI
jgi:hypothetical protein